MPKFDLSSIGDSLGDMGSSLKGMASGAGDSLKGMASGVGDFFQNNPRLTRSILAGLGTAGVAGGLTALSKRKNETREERRKRILRNALMMGVGGAGAVGLGDYAYGQLSTADPEATDPLGNTLRNWFGAIGLGGTGFHLNRQGRRLEEEQRRHLLSKYFGDDIVSEYGKPSDGGNTRQTAKSILAGRTNKENTTTMRGIVERLGEKGFEGRTGGRAGKDLRTAAGYVPGLKGTDDIGRFAKDIGNRTLTRGLAGAKSNLGRMGRIGQLAAAGLIPYSVVSALMSSPELQENTLGGVHLK